MKEIYNIGEDLEFYKNILTKYGINVTKTYMNGPVALANLETNDIDVKSCFQEEVELTKIMTPTNTCSDIFELRNIGKRISIEASVVNAVNFEHNVKTTYSKIYNNFSFYGLIYDSFYYLFEDKFYDLPKVSKIRGAFWGRKNDVDQ